MFSSAQIIVDCRGLRRGCRVFFPTLLQHFKAVSITIAASPTWVRWNARDALPEEGVGSGKPHTSMRLTQIAHTCMPMGPGFHCRLCRMPHQCLLNPLYQMLCWWFMLFSSHACYLSNSSSSSYPQTLSTSAQTYEELGKLDDAAQHTPWPKCQPTRPCLTCVQRMQRAQKPSLNLCRHPVRCLTLLAFKLSR